MKKKRLFLLFILFIASVLVGFVFAQQTGNVDTFKPWQELNQISKSSTDMTPVDADDNNIIDEAGGIKLEGCEIIFDESTATFDSIYGKDLLKINTPKNCMGGGCKIVIPAIFSFKTIEYVQLNDPTSITPPWYAITWPQSPPIGCSTPNNGKNGDSTSETIATLTTGISFLQDDYYIFPENSGYEVEIDKWVIQGKPAPGTLIYNCY